MSKKPTRRLFLKGVGGYMLSLPVLEVLLNDNGNAYADGTAIKSNYLYTYQGESSGHPRNNTMIWQPPTYGNLKTAYDQNPTAYGNQGIKSLADAGLLDDVNLISNLYINSNMPGTPGNIQVKGNSHPNSPIMHRVSNYNVNSGYGCPTDKNIWLNYRVPGGRHSTDQQFFEAIAREGKHMNFALEKYNTGWSQSTSMRDGYIQTPQKDVGAAFDALFGGFTPPADGGSVSSALTSRRSILNLVLDDHKRLQKKLGYNDRLLVDQHLTSISDLEKAIADQQENEPPTCSIPSRLSENVPLNSRNYGGEKERALLFNKIIALAMACGISRVGQYCILRHKAIVNPSDYVSPGWASIIANNAKLNNFHEIGHYSTQQSLDIWKEMSWWITGVYADLIQQFKNVSVGEGTLLDHSFIMMGMHQGIGLSLEGSSTDHVHSFENMSYMQAGGKALGAVTGRHINGGRKHPVAVANKAVELMGIDGLTFGDITDKVNIG